MRPRQANQVGTTRHQDRIDVIRLVDVAHRHGGHAGLVTDAVRERCLEHAAIDRPRFDRSLSRGDIADIDASLLQHAADADRVLRSDALGADPIVGGNAHRNRLLRRPDRAHGFEDFQGIAHAVLQRAAVFVGAPIGQRRDEGRQQIAVGAMDFEHAETGACRHFRGDDELVAHAIHIGAGHGASALIALRPGDR